MPESRKKQAKTPSSPSSGGPGKVSASEEILGEESRDRSEETAGRLGLGRWLLRIGMVALLAVGIGTLPLQLFGERGLTHYHRLKREHRDLVERNNKLQRKIRHLALEVRRLRDDEVTLERAARDDLGMVRPGEVIFVVDK